MEAGSRHISATILITSTDEGGLLMTYQDSFERRVILLGFVETTASHRKWTWRNETGQLNVALGSSSGSNRITACTAGPNTASFSTTILYFLNCFGESLEKSHPGPEMLHFWLNFTSTGNLAITLEDIEYSVTNGDSEPTIDSDITPLKQGAGVFLNQSTPQWGFGFQTGGVPLSSLRFPFNRLASTFADNATSTYLYHQLTDTILAEELWDGTSAFWIQSNVTIETS